MDGQPFFLVNKAVDPGLLQVLENEIVPRLEKDLPALVTPEELENNPYLHRFTIIFDREGYSPEFMKRMKEKRIACITYHKHPKENWSIEEFSAQKISSFAGNSIEVKLAERGSLLSNGLWVREVRRLSENEHQTSILSTDYCSDLTIVACKMASRWSQENFFKYMREHYNLDRLSDYSLDEIPDTTQVVNPNYRQLDSEVKRYNAKLSRLLAEFGSVHLEGKIEETLIEQYQKKKEDLQEKILEIQKNLSVAKEERKKTKHHIPLGALPEAQKFSRLSTKTKHLVDTIKMVAYRAETAMVNLLREAMARYHDGRSLLRSIYQTDADILPNEKEKTLTVRLHHLANPLSDDALRHLCKELNETEVVFPGTELRLIYILGTN
ncbi:MAG: hypothetical protein ACD_44C00428G0001 [uncultured bacterium]|nr:MAG: hypothetical protein ACD_44C00428G0001 [uncultured bacterium]